MYFYDGNLLLAEKVGSQIQKIYINDGQGIVGMVRPIYDGSTLTHYQRLYYLYDSLGSVSAIAGENGLPLQNYTYSPYGTCLNVTGDPINNLQFVGRYGGYLDNDTGLTYFWHRWYDSKDGRWISRDPIGVRGGINLYGYVKNRANKDIDKKGLDCTFCNPEQIINDSINQGINAIKSDPMNIIGEMYKQSAMCKFLKCVKKKIISHLIIEGVAKTVGDATLSEFAEFLTVIEVTSCVLESTSSICEPCE